MEHPSFNPESENLERELFLAALDLDDRKDRERFLESVCGTDSGLQNRVFRLLESHEESPNFMSDGQPPGGDKIFTEDTAVDQ